MAEHYVAKHVLDRSSGEGKSVRTCIVRPAIVYNAYSEPALGWIDSFNGPSGFSLFIALGLIRYTNLKMTNTVQLIPVDFLANFLICLPAHQAIRPICQQPQVFTLTSSPYFRADLYSLLKAGFKFTHQYPSMYIVRPIVLPPRISPLSPLQYRLLSFIYHDLWSYFMDALLTLTGHRKK
jgi:hypothetical protein